MTAPTTAVEWLLARAAVRATGLLHVVSRRDSGALNPLCGANPIRSEQIETHRVLTDVAGLCPGCATIAASIGGTVVDGVALLLGLSTSVATARLLEVSTSALRAAAGARTADEDLVASVQANGIVTPLLARRTPTGLVLVDGARRLDAATTAQLATIPVVVRDLDEHAAIVEQLLANLHRRDLDPIAQALAYQQALDELACTKQGLADRLGLSRPVIPNALRLLRLPEHLREHVAAGALTAEQGRRLTDLDGAEQDAAAAALLEQRQTRAAAPRAKADPALAGIAQSLTQLLDAKVRVTRAGDRATIRLDVPEADLARIVQQLGRLGVAA